MTHTSEINVVVMDFKVTGAHEVVTPNSDGTFTIFLNARDSSDQQRESYIHALSHIYNDDFYRDDLTATEIEALRHRIKVG